VVFSKQANARFRIVLKLLSDFVFFVKMNFDAAAAYDGWVARV